MKLVKQITLVLMLVLPFALFGQKKGVSFVVKANDYSVVVGKDSSTHNLVILTAPDGTIFQALPGRHENKVVEYVDSLKSPMFRVVLAEAPESLKDQVNFTFVTIIGFEGWNTDQRFAETDNNAATGNENSGPRRNRSNNNTQPAALPTGVTAQMRITNFTTFNGSNTTEITTPTGTVVAWTKMLEGKNVKNEEIYHISTTGNVTRSTTVLYFHSTGEKVTYLNGVEQSRTTMN